MLLKKHLELYKKIVWRKQQYQAYRYKYYSFLANNAAFTHKDGAVIYYLQKAEEELKKKQPYINSLNEPRQLLTIYGTNENANYEKRKAVFERVLPFLKALPQYILNQEVPPNTCTNAMTILNNASRLYAHIQDTAMVVVILGISGKLWNSLQERSNLTRDKMDQCRYLYYQVQYTANRVQGGAEIARAILDSSYTVIRSDTTINQVWTRSVERALLVKYIDFFLSRNQTDSSRYYLQLLARKRNKNDPGEYTTELLYSAKISALEHDFQRAYHDLLDAYEINDSIIDLKTADINNNLYAQLVAEQKQEEITDLQKQKQQQRMIIAGASLLAMLCIAFLVVLMRRKDKKNRRKIEALNRLTQIEIAELEIKANLIQRRLGMELHNDIAGKLVYLCNTIDKKILDEADPTHRNSLKVICDLARDTYLDTRNKSHEWYAEGLKEEQTAFRESVNKITAYALPDGQFEKVIEIDDDSMQKVSNQVRIALLRVIQESFVNILKHAAARKMYLYIYEEDQTIITQIKDNGRGFDVRLQRKKNGIGLSSLQRKIKELGGTLNIHSSKDGTEIIAAIPI
ncbi:hypothetical protein LQ567_03010 [Niabella pedocola]|uniref:histidine kinase n=1 Tax=Niabella pedocola TaxID=1752077 RepID=A0ABS8PKV6_9BACT|nr:ATP-binding protein [Niabella pedocola]MCD2421715.1 hypothetical protein [Niabella pedocola]